MIIEILEPLVLTTVPRETEAPWLGKGSTKIQLVERFVVSVYDPMESVDLELVVPSGYVSDWASIPKLFWRLFPPNYSESRHGSILHDYIYSHLYLYFSKSFADRLLRDCMRHDGAGKLASTAFYLAVSVGGCGGWSECRKKNSDPHWKKQHPLIPYRGMSVDEAKEALDCGV